MVTRKLVWLAPRERDSGWPGRAGRSGRGLGSAPRALLWLAGAGAVAFWVWQFQRRTNVANAIIPDFPLSEQSSAGHTGSSASSAPAAHALHRAPSPAATLPFRRAPTFLPARSSHWVYRARHALRQGAPALRQLAAEMAHAGLEAEGSLLGNYASLLERTNTRRARVQAEVIRLLEEASVERGAAPGEWQRRIVPMPVVPPEARRRAG